MHRIIKARLCQVFFYLNYHVIYYLYQKLALLS